MPVFRFKRYLMVALGALICSASINTFYVPNSMLSGGVSGIAMIVYYMIGIPMSITSISINIPLFFFANRLMDRSFVLVSLFGMLLFAFSLDGLRFLADLKVTDDLLIAALCGGLGNGLGAALMYRVNGGSGGTDIIAAILNKFYGISYGTFSSCFNAVIMAISVFLLGIEPAIYTFIGIYIAARATDKVTAGFDDRKTVLIISPEYRKIAAAIFQEIGRGVTFLSGEGAYTGQSKKVVFVVISLTQIAKIKSLVYKYDPAAFMIVQEATDVMGKGFTMKSDAQIQQDLERAEKKRRLKNIAQIHQKRLEEELKNKEGAWID